MSVRWAEMNNYQNISAAKLQAMLHVGNVQLVDVRTEAEIAHGIIAGARKLPLHLLPLQLEELDAYWPTVFYCQIGARSAQAAALAVNRGMREVYNLQGGITAWVHGGGEIHNEHGI